VTGRVGRFDQASPAWGFTFSVNLTDPVGLDRFSRLCFTHK
jgi:hypothetical protein